MKRDSIFYRLLQQSPASIFALLPKRPAHAEGYRFDSVAVKEPRFEIDGVLIPPEGIIGTIYFIEIQFQEDKAFYERIFAETALYFYRNYQRFSDWEVIVIYPNRSKEQKRLHPHRSLLNGPQVHRIFLDELGDIRSLPIQISMMVLTTLSETQAPAEARYLISRVQNEVSAEERRGMIELITSIISYRFGQLSVREVESMLDIKFEETRVYQELKEKAEQEGLQRGLKQGVKQGIEQGIEQGVRQGIEQGIEQGRREEAAVFAIKLLTKRFGELEPDTETAIAALSLERLESLGEMLLEFRDSVELRQWLAQE